ncbi:hypothetical protein AAC387_Pa09g1994 [Persea americana]
MENAESNVSLTVWKREATVTAEIYRSFEKERELLKALTSGSHIDMPKEKGKTSASSTIKVRIENMANNYGSPSMTDIEDFSSACHACLDEAKISSPGVERIVQVPQQLDRFKDLPMYVKYDTEEASTESPKESDGVFKLVSFDLESTYCTWSIADVRKNREEAGEGRPLSKKQKEWRLQTPFDSLRLVRLYSDCRYSLYHVLLEFLR